MVLGYLLTGRCYASPRFALVVALEAEVERVENAAAAAADAGGEAEEYSPLVLHRAPLEGVVGERSARELLKAFGVSHDEDGAPAPRRRPQDIFRLPRMRLGMM